MNVTDFRYKETGPIFYGAIPLKRIFASTGAPTNSFDYDDFAPSHKPIQRQSFRTSYEERYPRKEQDRLVDSASSRNNWNYFEHYESKSTVPDGSSTHYIGAYTTPPVYYHKVQVPGLFAEGWQSGAFGSIDNPIKGLPALYVKDGATGRFVANIPDLSNIVQRSLATMLGQVRPQQSLLNNLFELKDFKTMPRTLTRIRDTLLELRKRFPKLASDFRNLFPKKGKKPILSVLGAASDVFLQQEFNIKPLIQDISGVASALETERRRIAKLVDNAGKKIRRDYNLDLSTYYRDSSETSTSSSIQRISNLPIYDASRGRSVRDVRYHKALFHAQIEYSYYYTDWQRRNALLLSQLDKLGVNFNPSIIWNAIPWSFVIDWVVDVGRWLDQFGASNMEPLTVIHRFSYSHRVVRSIKCSHSTYASEASWGPLVTPMRVVNVFTEDAYFRTPSSVNVVAALTGSGINAKEFILASALKLSRFK